MSSPPLSQGTSKGGGRVPKPVAAGVAVALLVGAVIALGVLWGDGFGDGAQPASQPTTTSAAPAWTAQAAARLGSLPALRYTGTFVSSGQTVQADLSVTRAGSAIGTLTKNGRQAQLVTVGGATYLKGGPSFWTSVGRSTALPEDFADRWSKAPATVLGFDIKAFLSPSSIAKLVREAPAGTGTEFIGDRPARKVQTSLGVYSLAAGSPHELLKVEGGSDTRLDAAPVPDAAPVLTELRRRVGDLGGARDPGVRFDHGELKFVNCNENVDGCTLSLPVSTQTPAVAGSGDLTAVLTATISADGRALGSCSATAALGPSREATLTCEVTSKGWKDWMRRAREVPGAHQYSARARVIAEVVSTDQVATLLKEVGQEGTGR